MNRLLTFSLIALIGYMVLIFYLSSLSADVPAGIGFPEMPRTVMHIGEYAILGFLMNLVVMQVFSKMRRSLLYSAVFSSTYGLTDEIHQYFVPTRCFDIYDICADALGGVAGAVFLIVLLPLMKGEETG
jgi:VanZ family protein